ncbi:MAG TPA: pyruvate ferredoxin oxidoreductase, partial [Streptosporangiaceae bacterium]|nr:pyruvate ferredoxin oxidoreductase [Streptosporangiaceae bacterium]
MPAQPIKFYQTGSFAVGNRLLDPGQRTVQSDADRANSISSGHRACQGCGEALGARYALDAAMRATNGQLIAVNATGCLEVFSTPFPETSWRIPWIHSLFGNAPAVATGVAAAMRVKGRPDVR